ESANLGTLAALAGSDGLAMLPDGSEGDVQTGGEGLLHPRDETMRRVLRNAAANRSLQVQDGKHLGVGPMMGQASQAFIETLLAGKLPLEFEDAPKQVIVPRQWIMQRQNEMDPMNRQGRGARRQRVGQQRALGLGQVPRRQLRQPPAIQKRTDVCLERSCFG